MLNRDKITEQKNYLSVNLFRVIIGGLALFVAFQVNIRFLVYFSFFYLVWSILWLLLTVRRLIDEEGQIAYLVTIFDLSLFGFFIYISDTSSSPLTMSLLYATAVSSLNLKLKQGFLSLIYGNILYSSLSCAVYLKFIPHLNVFGEIREMSFLGFLVSISIFNSANTALYFFIQSLSRANQSLLLQKDREKEEAEKAYLEAENSNQSKRYFLANMSHEIRTPMNGILGLGSLLKNTNLDEEQTDFLDSIIISADNLLTIINDILDFSKIEENKLELVFQNFQLENLIQEVYSLFRYRIREKEIQWKICLSDDLPKWIHSDPLRLKQILINIIGNALKFTPSLGSIELVVTLKELIESGLTISFLVKDSGIGIAPEKIHKLFKPFEQLDATTTRQYGGTGLGLAISSKLVNMFGGKFEVVSKPGSGTSFGFFIKVGIDHPSEVNAPVVLIKNGPINKISINKQLRILSVDDNEINQLLMQKTAQRLNLTMDYVRDGRQAVFAHYYEPYDLIFMDLQMPVMGGLDATKRIRKIEKQSRNHVLIVAMTANAFPEDRINCEVAGMDDFLAKPVKAEAIVEIISKYGHVPTPRNK